MHRPSPLRYGKCTAKISRTPTSHLGYTLRGSSRRLCTALEDPRFICCSCGLPVRSSLHAILRRGSAKLGNLDVNRGELVALNAIEPKGERLELALFIGFRILARKYRAHLAHIRACELVVAASERDLSLQKLHARTPVRITGKLSNRLDVDFVRELCSFIHLSQADETGCEG